MKINELYKQNEEITVNSYLNKYGIQNIDDFLYPKSNQIDNYNGYYHIKNAIDLFDKHFKKLSPTYIICDSDLDGITSAVILYQYMSAMMNWHEVDWDVQILIHEGKERGLQDEKILQQIKNNPRPFVIIPDAGTNDCEQALELSNLNIDILVLDHHDIETPIALKNGIVINNQNPKNKNISKNGSGCLVTHMFLQALDNKYDNEWCHMLWDMVAISLISDSMDMSDLQNRTYYHYGIETIDDIFNPFLRTTFEKFIGNIPYTQRDISFKIVPKFNSVIRSDNNELKQKVIQGFIGIDINFKDILEKCDECHKNQIKLLDTIIDHNKDKIEEAKENNIVLLSCDDMPRSYSGLVAGKIMNICNKPTIVGKIKDDKLIGSLRSPIPLRNDLNENELVEWAFGHENSCGVSIEEKNIDKLIEYYNSLDISYEPYTDVLRAYSINDIPNTIYSLFGDNLNVLWGYGLPKPLFEIHDIIYYPSDIQILGANKRTLKLINNNISFLIFNVTKQQKADLGLGYIVDGEYYDRDNLDDTQYSLSCIGNLSINRYKNYINNQMIIDKFTSKIYTPKTVDNIFKRR